MADVFISYSRKDKDFVRRLDEELKSRGREAWVDWEGIRPTEEFMQAIYGAIEGVDTFVFVLTPDSVASVVCGREIAHAAAHNKRMVPIVARDVNADTVPEALAKLNWIFCRDIDDFEKATDTLITAFDTDLDWVHAHTRLLTRAIEWEAKGKSNSFVLRGEDLRAAEQWLAQAAPDKERQPTALQTEYIIASRKAAARRRRIWLGALTFGLIVSSVLAVVALIARHKAVEQEAKAKNTSVQADFDLALTLRGDAAAPNPRMFPHLARALRVLPDATLPRRYLISLLRDKPWILPQTEPLRHQGEIKAAAFSPDGRRLATVSSDQTARIWDAETGRLAGNPLPHDSDVVAVAFSPDGTRLATCSGYRTQVWDVVTEKPIAEPSLGMGVASSVQWSSDGRRILPTRGFLLRVWDAERIKPIGEPLEALSLSPNGEYAVAFSNDAVQLWKLDTMQPIGTPWGKSEGIERSAPNTKAIFSENGHRFAVWSGTLAYICDTTSGQLLAGPLRHGKEIAAAAFTYDGRRLVTCAGQLAQIWEGETGQPSGEPLNHADVYEAVFNADGTRLLTRGSGNTAALWDVQSGKRLGKELTHTDLGGADAFSSDGKLIVTASDKTARMWDARTGEPVGEPLWHDAPVVLAKFNPKSPTLLTVSSGDSIARLWETPTQPFRSTPLPVGSAASVIAFSPDGRYLAVGSSDGSVRVCDSNTGRSSAAELHHEKAIHTVAFSADGRLLATGSTDKTARLWDAKTGRPRSEPLPHDTAVEAIAFSGDGRRMLTHDFNARVWDVETPRQLRVFGPAFTTKVSRSGNVVRITRAAISPDGRSVLTDDSTGRVQVWSVETGEPISELAPAGLGIDRESVVFSPDGHLILTGATDGTVKCWVTETGQPLNFAIHHLQNAAACFSPSGRQILTWSADSTAALWDAETGRQFGETLRHKENVDSAAFTRDGLVVITRSANEIRFWDAATGKAVSEPLQHPGSVQSAVVSADGRRLATISGDAAQIWDVAADLDSPLPSWVPELAEALGNRRLDERSTLVMPTKSIPVLRKELLALKGDDFWSRFGRWFFMRGPNRTISPDSKITVGELERLRTAAEANSAKEPAQSLLTPQATTPK